MHPDPTRTPDGQHGIGNFEMQARPVLNRSAIGVGTLVAAVL
jgi:hypothetical protein